MSSAQQSCAALDAIGTFFLAICLAGCVASVQPQMPVDVAAALARDPMRRLDTPSLSLYYPAGRRAETLHFAERLEGCAQLLRARMLFHNDIADRRMAVILPELTFNNAFTSPIAGGYEPFAVVPTFQTVDGFSLQMGLPPDAGIIGCHELTHYVHFLAVAGFSYLVDLVFGEAYTPQLGFDGWFDEGLAVYYETLLQPGVGRLAWPFWHGAFAAGLAGRRLRGGDLSEFNRDAFMGNHYLVGSHFIQFLADRYGEWRLWKVIEVQSRSILFPVGLNVRFWQAYDKSLSTLFDEFADDVARRTPETPRPAEQRVLAALGTDARYARGPDGSEAWITDGHDTPPRLVVRGPDGRTRVDRALIDVLPPRKLIVASAGGCGPPSFTADGRLVYFTSVDQGPTFQTSRLVRVDTATGALTIVLGELRGGGGAISPDGMTYAFAHAEGDHHDLVLFDLASRQARVLVSEPPGAFVSLPRYSTDGERIVASVFEGGAFWIRVFDARSGRVLATIGDGRSPVHDASFATADASHVVYLASDVAGAGFQVHLADLQTGQTRAITRAPYLAFQPQLQGTQLRFLNRDGWNWTLDEQEIPLLTSGGAPASAPPPAPPPPPQPLVEPVAVLRDEPYQPTDHLFSPQLHGVSVVAAGRSGVIGDLVLAGGDRLQFHRWSLDGLLQLNGGHPGYGLGAGYANRQLAPFTIVATGLALRYHDQRPPAPPQMSPTPISPEPFLLEKTQLQANLLVDRVIYGSPIDLGFNVTDDNQPGEPTLLFQHRRVAGPFLQATYEGVETTPYAGVRRAAAAFPSVAIYPAAWNTAGATITDLGLSLVGVTPLPLSRRHTLRLNLRGRGLVGLPDGAQWLQVGGGVTALERTGAVGRVPPEVTIASLPSVHFLEPLRGYEDYPIATDRIFIAELTYRYPLIVDRGSTSTLWVLPSAFFQQANLELFASAASDAHGGNPHAAGGASLTLDLALWRLPFSVAYQIARRVEDDHALVQILAVSLD
jgi:hypothetical protein